MMLFENCFDRFISCLISIKNGIERKKRNGWYDDKLNLDKIQDIIRSNGKKIIQ